MLDAASLQAVPIPHRQGVATCSGMDELCHGAASLSSWLSHQHGITPSWPQHSPRQQWQPHGGTSPVSSWGSGQHRGLMQRCLQQHGGLQLLPGSKADPLGCIEPLSWSGMQKGGLSGAASPPGTFGRLTVPNHEGSQCVPGAEQLPLRILPADTLEEPPAAGTE